MDNRKEHVIIKDHPRIRGKDLDLCLCQSNVPEDHPRIRGKDDDVWNVFFKEAGSPPHTRERPLGYDEMT